MKATAVVVFDSNYLRDLLIVKSAVVAETRVHDVHSVHISLEDDQFVDELVEKLTAFRDDRIRRHLKRDVERLMRQQGDAIKSRQQRHDDWLRADAHLNKVQTELSAAMQELDALTAQEGS